MAEALIHLTMKILEEMGLNEVRIRSGEGNGTPLQYSCLENSMDRGAWRAAVHGVAESRTRLKRLSSSSSSRIRRETTQAERKDADI